MKTLFVFASVMVVLFLADPNNVEAQKRKATKPKQTYDKKSLSRSKAAELISKYATFLGPSTIEFNDDHPDKAGIATIPLYRALKSLGYMDSDFKLTEKGKTSIAGLKFVRVAEYRSDYFKVYQNWKVYSMPILNIREIVEVTGISDENPVGAVKKAEFTWRWEPVNDIAKALNIEKVTYYGSYAVFKKFDDGWRVDRIQLYEWRTEKP